MDGVHGDEPGGIAGLLELLAEHAEAVEADLARFYGAHLGDVGTAALSWRRLRVLLAQLPPEAALWRSADSPRQWGWVEHLLAGAAHAVHSGNWQRGGGKGRRPKPLDPWAAKQSGATRTMGTALPVEDMRALLDDWASGGLRSKTGNEEEVTDDGD